MCGQQRNSPMADPIFGSKYGPQNGVQNWISFSFLLLGLCLGPVLGSRFGPKSGVSHRRILLLPAEVLQADLRRTSMSVSVNTCFFSLCVPLCFLYSMFSHCTCQTCFSNVFCELFILCSCGCPCLRVWWAGASFYVPWTISVPPKTYPKLSWQGGVIVQPSWIPNPLAWFSF